MVAYPEMDDVFRALADPSRRLLLDRLNAANGLTLRELSSGLDMTRQSVSKHLAVLEKANLVSSVRRGREKLHYLNAAPINEISERWINHYERERVEALADLKRALEDSPMDKPSFVYTTYIRTTPEQLWRALTEPEFTERYWFGLTFESDWQTGSTMVWNQRGVTTADSEQVVLESDPYRRLSYTWHTWTPELIAALDMNEDTATRVVAEPRSKVTFEIEPQGELVKLTVLHETGDPDSVVTRMISTGWPKVISNLKTLLETGEAASTSNVPSTTQTLGLTAS